PRPHARPPDHECGEGYRRLRESALKSRFDDGPLGSDSARLPWSARECSIAAEGAFGVSSKRRSYESGHRPKFMVVIDGTPESLRAVHFASRRAARTGASMIMLAAVNPPDNFEWIGVGEA